MKKQAIVIGSGVAGIASAIRLSVKGYKVDLFESNSYPGGKITAIERKGYRFDAGPSLFTLPHLVEELFTLCGENPSQHFKYITKEESCRYFWEDGTHLIAGTSAETTSLEVEKALGVPAETVRNYLRESAFIWNRTRPFFLERSLHKLNSYLDPTLIPTLLSIHRLHLTSTLHRVNSKKLQHPKLVQIFDRYATYNGSDPYQTPGVMTVIPHLEHNLGTYLPEGGMHDITTSLVALAERQGVTFHYNSPVSKILIHEQKAAGVEVGGVKAFADVVVSNMDIVPTYRKLLSDRPAPETVLSQERSSSALIFYWGIKGEFQDLGLHNIFFSKDYEAEFKAIFQENRVIDDPTVYVNITSKDVAGDAPNGSENWFVMVNTPGDKGQDWDRIIPEVRRNVLDKLTRLLNRDIESLIEVEEMLTPRLIESRTSSFQGSLYGASSNNPLAAFLRHPNFSQRISGLFFCGGSVHPGGGIPLSLLSAKIVGSLVKPGT